MCWACCAGEAADPGDPVEPLRREDVRQGRMWREGAGQAMVFTHPSWTVADAGGLVYGGCRVVMGRSKVQLKVNATIQDSQPGGRKSRGISKGACTGLTAPGRIRPRPADSANGGSQQSAVGRPCSRPARSRPACRPSRRRASGTVRAQQKPMRRAAMSR